MENGVRGINCYFKRERIDTDDDGSLELLDRQDSPEASRQRALNEARSRLSSLFKQAKNYQFLTSKDVRNIVNEHRAFITKNDVLSIMSEEGFEDKPISATINGKSMYVYKKK